MAQDNQSPTLEQLRRIDRGEHKPLSLNPERTVLLIVDMQRYFVRPDYPFAQTFEKLYPGVSTEYFERIGTIVVPNCQRLQAAFRSTNAAVMYTAFGSHRADGSDLPGWARKDNEEFAVELETGGSRPARVVERLKECRLPVVIAVTSRRLLQRFERVPTQGLRLVLAEDLAHPRRGRTETFRSSWARSAVQGGSGVPNEAKRTKL